MLGAGTLKAAANESIYIHRLSVKMGDWRAPPTRRRAQRRQLLGQCDIDQLIERDPLGLGDFCAPRREAKAAAATLNCIFLILSSAGGRWLAR
jgi:hypothetical protein